MDCLRNCFHRLKESRLLLDFNVPAVATVLLPLFMWMIAFLAAGDDGEKGGAEDQGGEGAALGFVYIWSLLIFVGIVWYGNLVLEGDNQDLLKVLMAALFVFTNFALMLALLTGRFVVSVCCRYYRIVSHGIPRLTHHSLDASFTRGRKGLAKTVSSCHGVDVCILGFVWCYLESPTLS
jgi:hypothetical protein